MFYVCKSSRRNPRRCMVTNQQREKNYEKKCDRRTVRRPHSGDQCQSGRCLQDSKGYGSGYHIRYALWHSGFVGEKDRGSGGKDPQRHGCGTFELEIMAFFYIGGNDSMDTIKKLSDYAETVGNPIRFIGVPKTIDNDLEGTDHTPGYGSAAKYIATVTKELVRDGLIYEMQSVTVIEIMGRNAGWLTGAAVLAKSEDCEGPDLIYLPEVAFDVDDFLKKVKKLVSEKQSIVIAVSEGIKTADGRYVCELSAPSDKTDSFGHVQLSGTGKYLSDLIIEKLGCKSRAIELSTLQRCAGHLTSRVDITEAYQVGGTAVKAAFEGKTGQMVILKRVSQDPYICTTDLYDVHKVANLEKKVPRSWITEEGDYVTAEMKNYIEPLIQAELTPIMITGQPRHIIIDDL